MRRLVQSILLLVDDPLMEFQPIFSIFDIFFIRCLFPAHPQTNAARGLSNEYNKNLT